MAKRIDAFAISEKDLLAKHNLLVEQTAKAVKGETIITEINENGGTPISNADMLDGLHGSSYQLAGDYLLKSGGIMTGALEADSNTGYTTRQVRNVILSTQDADVNQMQDGDIWMKYEE